MPLFLKELICKSCKEKFSIATNRDLPQWAFEKDPDDPDMCSDCMKGLPHETKKLRHVLSQISKLIETPGALNRAEFYVIYKAIMIFSKDA